MLNRCQNVKRCQNVQKMSNCQNSVKYQKVKQLNYGVQQKKLDTVRFKHNDVNFDVTYESHQNWSKTYFMSI